MVINSTKKLFTPRLQLEPAGPGGRMQLVNTTGDRIDPEKTLVLAKANATEGTDKEGKAHLLVRHQDKDVWVPKDSFQVSDGENGVYYLPTFKDSPGGAALAGGSKALVALGPLAAISAGTAGYAAHKLGKNAPSKLAIGAGVGAVALAATNTALFGPAGIPISLMLGATAGISAVHAGEGSAEIRDASYGGGIAGFAVGALTQNPIALLTGSAAAGIGARASHPIAKAVLGGAVGAAFGAGQAFLSGQPIAMVAGLTAAAGAVGPLIGSPLMQVTRNLSQDGGELVAKALQNSSDTTLKVVGSVPYAVGMGLLGLSAELVAPGTGAIGAAIGVAGGAAYGYYKTAGQLEKAKTGARAA